MARLACVIAFALPAFSSLHSETIGYYKGTDCAINSINDVNSGCTASNYLTVQYGGFVNGRTYTSGWTLRIRANGNFSNGTNTISAQYVSIRFASASSGPTGVTGSGYRTLSTSTTQSLYTTSSSITTPSTYFFEHKFDMRVTGGNHLTVGAGTYTGTVTLTFVDRNGNTIASNNNVQLSFVVNYSSTCSGATISSYSGVQPTFTTYLQKYNGITVTDAATVQYNPNNATCAGWTLKVRATGNFTNGSSTVSPQYFSLRFNRVSAGTPTAADIGVTNNAVVLSTSDVTLINQSDASFSAYTATEHKFDMLIEGGWHLVFLPNGLYTTNLIFTLYNQNNQVVSTTTMQMTFAVNTSGNTYSIVLQNTADNVNLAFTSPSDYTGGVSVTKTNGLKVTGYSGYQVLVKTSSANLTSSGGGSIPASAVSLEALQTTSTAPGINTYTRELSNSDQVIITNPVTDNSQSVVEYTLRYFTKPGDNRLNQPSGTYSTTVIFVAIPN